MDLALHLKHMKGKELSEEGKKFDDDKLRYDLIPPECLAGLAEVLTYGAKKYGDDNWQKIEVQRYVSALFRHLEAWRMGEQNDSESGIHHLKHAMANSMFLLWNSINNEDVSI